MEGIYKELDEVKAEMVKLKAECQIKTELSESLKRAHNEQLLKYQEAKQHIEKQAQELNSKSEEISEARQIHEDLKSSLHEKEISLRHFSYVNEKLRADCGQKLQKLEGENRELVLALNEVTGRSKELEQNVCASHKEIEGFKSLLIVAERKCFEVEQRAQKIKEVRQRDDVILKLEEENRDVRDQLKWKNEQFKHLEEAHKRLQDLFQLSKEEWERGKSALLEEISSLQTSLDSQTRILEGLQTRLEMCNQALALEESRRKFLEVQVSELNSRFNNVFSQCDEENSKIQNLIVLRDEEIGRLRNSLGRKETLVKEMEFRIVHLEQENQELGESLKDFREAQIRNAGANSSLTKLRNKLRGLEQVHSNCSTNLKAKESKLGFQIEKMGKEIDSYKSELEVKEKQIEELHMELESCHSAIEVLNEEIPIVCMVLKSEFSEAYSEIFNAKAEMKLHNKEKEDINSPLTEQLAVNKSYSDLQKDNEELTSLRKRVKSLECMLAAKEDELQQHKKLLKELSQLRLKDQVLQMESALQNEKKDVFETLEKANLELAEKSCEVSRVEYELQKWKSNAKSLKACFDENQETCKQMETYLIEQAKLSQTVENEKESLLCIVKEQVNIIKGLQQEIVSLAAMKEAFEQEKDSILLIAEEKDSFTENFQKDVTFLKEESMRREAESAVLARQAAEKAFEQEKGRLLQIMNEKDQRIKDLRVLAISLEQDMKSTAISCFEEATEKQVEIYVLGEAIKNADYLINVEIEEKNKVIVNLETEACNLRQKLAFEEESFLHSKRQAEQLQELLEANKFETEKLKDEQRKMEGIVKELDWEKGILLQDSKKLLTERQNLLVHIQEICDEIGEFSSEDVKLMKILGRISQNSEEETGGAMSLVMHSELYDSIRENAESCDSGTTKKPEVGGDERSPLKEVNHRQL
ncbi:hypothetical protein FH972_005735 [Carpinus fangiana]|uniref:Uncharacterized protein n=1 Tax=Carpinus fangiana TaxID=176857 RepID=A0A5N6QS30_9ROSI|nr:hypothetical protein FH972_005735 [Carpinus fangiana]